MNDIAKYCGLTFVMFFLLYWFKVRIRIPKGYQLPPGPPRKPLIGNLLDIPLKKEWRTYHKWSKIYGDLTYLNICGVSILVVNSHKLVSELFDQRGAIYSDRFQSTMLGELAGISNLATYQPHEKWKHQRSIFHRYFSKSSISQYQVLLDKSAGKLLHHLYRHPEALEEATRYAIGSLVIEITYGIEILTQNDPCIRMAENVAAFIREVSKPGACLVDLIPALKYIPSCVPGASFQKKAKQLNAEFISMVTVPFNIVRNTMKTGCATPSIVGSFLEEIESKGSETAESDQQTIQEVGAMIYMAALDTTVSSVQTFILAMLLYPGVQKKAQRELDNLEGVLPSLNDRKNLPYVDALCKEVLRWHAAVPLGFPHMLKKDDIIGEYFVPKGTLVMGNTWTLLHSVSLFGDDAETFNPERFLKRGVNYPDAAFGFGRRICPGRHLADSILFTMVTRILYAFDITPHEGPTGQELPGIDHFTSGIISNPQPFKCKFIPRTPQSKMFLEQLSAFEA